jgi:hydrogenase/urease accessory protein HupE
VIDATGKVSETQSTSLWAWIVAGFEHIIPKGVDHILFILGLFLLQPKIRPLLWQTTAFTIAHSITLALAVLGVLSVSSRIVEPAIALSIAYVGIENIWVKELKPWRVSLVFCLGLLHGMGFASVMQELEIPKGSVIKPLLGFNLGVEGGQIAVLSVAFLLTFALLKKPSFRWVRLVGSVLIGIMGLYWTVDRIIG